MTNFRYSINDEPNDIAAESITDALRMIKAANPDANWDMFPIFTGEARIDTEFKANGRKYSVVILNPIFIPRYL